MIAEGELDDHHDAKLGGGRLEVHIAARSRLLVSWGGILAATCLVLLGLRQFTADILVAPERDILADLQDGKPRSNDDILALISAEKNSLAVAPSPQTLSDLSLAQATLAAGSDNPDAKLALLSEARGNLLKSLQAAPANPYAWVRLAMLSRALDRPDEEIYKYWQLSVMTGPNEDKILTPRILLGVDLWPLLGPSDRQSVFADIRNLWAHDHGWQIANDASPFMVNVIRAALVTDIKIFLEYEVFEKARQLGIKAKAAQKSASTSDQK